MSQQPNIINLSLSKLIDTSMKVKQFYIKLTNTLKVVIFRDEVMITRNTRDSKFSMRELPKALRILMRLGILTTDCETDKDDLDYTSYIKLSLERKTVTISQDVINAIIHEIIAPDVTITHVRTQSEIMYIETSKSPIKTISVLYQPLGIVLEIGSYGIADIDGLSSYVYSVSCSPGEQSEKKRVIGLKHLLVCDLLYNTLGNTHQLHYESQDIFSLPDGVRIEYTNKSNNGIVYNGKLVSYGSAIFLASMLPEIGWFVKVNRRIGKVSTVLLTETSWIMGAKQKAYVEKYLRN